MATETIDEEKLKGLLKSALIEVLEERRDLERFALEFTKSKGSQYFV